MIKSSPLGVAVGMCLLAIATVVDAQHYQSPEQAVVERFNSLVDNRADQLGAGEYSGFVVRDGSNYYTTAPSYAYGTSSEYPHTAASGAAFHRLRTNLRRRGGDLEVVASYHTHPAMAQDVGRAAGDPFSNQDKAVARRENMPSYVLEPSGRVWRYDHTANTTSEVGEVNGTYKNRLPKARRVRVRGGCACKAVEQEAFRSSGIVAGTSTDGDGCPCVAAAVGVGRTHGDPHVFTLDGFNYAFQGVGEFVALRSTIDDFEIQYRLTPWKESKSVSVLTSIAVTAFGNHFLAKLGQPPRVEVNGHLDPEKWEESLAGGVFFSRTGNHLSIESPWSDVISIRLLEEGMAVNVALSEYRTGLVEGLLGDADGDPTNDLRPRGGDTLFFPTSIDGAYEAAVHDVTYGAFAESWRVTLADSLFDYEDGKGPEDWHNRSLPSRESGIDENQGRADAIAACRELKSVDSAMYESCLFDVQVTGDRSFATSAKMAHDDHVRLLRESKWQSADFSAQLSSVTPNAKHLFWAEEGEAFLVNTIQITGGLDFSRLRVLDPEGAVLIKTCVRCNILGLFEAKQSGLHAISSLRTDDEVGSYALKAWRVAEPQRFEPVSAGLVSAETLGPGAGLIEHPGSQDHFIIELTNGQRLTISGVAKDASLEFARYEISRSGSPGILQNGLLPGAGSASEPFNVPTDGRYLVNVMADTSGVAQSFVGSGSYQFEFIIQ